MDLGRHPFEFDSITSDEVSELVALKSYRAELQREAYERAEAEAEEQRLWDLMNST